VEEITNALQSGKFIPTIKQISISQDEDEEDDEQEERLDEH